MQFDTEIRGFSFQRPVARDTRKNYSILLTICGALGLASCQANLDPSGLGQTPVASAAVAEPIIGYILFVGDVDGRRNLYKQDMNGLNPDGPPVRVYDLDYDVAEGAGDARYPKITSDGRYFIFITRKSDGCCGGVGADEIQLYDHTGYAQNSFVMPMAKRDGSYCLTFNYPEIVDYRLGTFPHTPDMLVAFTCVDDWDNRESMTATMGQAFAGYFSRGSGNTPPGDGYTNGLEKLRPTEFTIYPGYTAANGGFIVSSHEDRMWVSELVHNQQGDDFLGDALIHASPGQAREAGYCKSGNTVPGPGGSTMPCPIPSPTVLRDGFAPSISSDGAYLMYNADAFDNDPQRNEELFVINLPSSDLRNAYRQSFPSQGVFQSTINLMPHVNDARSHYGRFAVNGLHQYVLYSKDGDGLWVAQDLTSAPVQVPLPPNMKAIDAAWFYREN